MGETGESLESLGIFFGETWGETMGTWDFSNGKLMEIVTHMGFNDQFGWTVFQKDVNVNLHALELQ